MPGGGIPQLVYTALQHFDQEFAVRIAVGTAFCLCYPAGFSQGGGEHARSRTCLVHAYFGMYIGKAVTVRAFIMPVDCVGFISFHYFLKGVSVPLGNGLVAFHDFRQCLSPDLVRGDAFSLSLIHIWK